MSKEKGADYYDFAVCAYPRLSEHYARRSKYYPLLAAVLSKIPDKTSRILDLGCGAGQLAHLFYNNGYHSYTGIDFSPEMLKIARRWRTPYRFLERDIRIPDSIVDLEYDIVVSTEFVEHITDDLEILGRINSGTTVIISTTNRPGKEHVRFFPSEEDVWHRYKRVIDIDGLLVLRSEVLPDFGWVVFYVFWGVVR
jgi:2-polyprenyl-3-methyl-5-hydroxy-6-metoxy-1,4-benzoquinol methylase